MPWGSQSPGQLGGLREIEKIYGVCVYVCVCEREREKEKERGYQASLKASLKISQLAIYKVNFFLITQWILLHL